MAEPQNTTDHRAGKVTAATVAGGALGAGLGAWKKKNLLVSGLMGSGFGGALMGAGTGNWKNKLATKARSANQEKQVYVRPQGHQPAQTPGYPQQSYYPQSSYQKTSMAHTLLGK